MTHSVQGQQRDLEYYITEGLGRSPALAELQNQVQAGSLDSLLVRAAQKPQVGFTGLMYYAPVINGYGYAEPITNISNLTSVVTASQRIFNQKILAADFSKAGIRNQSLRVTSQITANGLKKAITAQYLAVCAKASDISFNQELLLLLQDESTLVRQLAEQGIYRQTEYMAVLLELKNQKIALANLGTEYRKELAALNLLCGLTDTAFYQLALPDLRLTGPADPAHSPYFRQFEIDSLRIVNERLLADVPYKPAFRWFTDAGLINNLPEDIYKNFGLSLGLSLTLPIYDGQQRKYNYEKLRIDERTRSGYASYIRQQYNQQLEQLYHELAATQNLIPDVRDQMQLAENILKQDAVLINSGDVPVTEYILALRNYATAKSTLNQYQVKVLQLVNEINYWNQ